MRRSAFFIACIVLLTGLAGTTGAREIAREDFESGPGGPAEALIAPGKGSKGGISHGDPAFFVEKPLFVDLPVAFDNAVRKGSFSFDLQRKPGGVPGDFRTVFAVQDRDGMNLMIVQLAWSSGADPRFPALAIGGFEYHNNHMGLWSEWTLVDREVAPGQWIHVDLTWDDDAKRYRLHVDGKEVDAVPAYFDPVEKRVLPDPRDEGNRELARHGQPPVFRSLPFAELLAKARNVRLGVNAHSGKPGKGSSPLASAVLDNFVVHVDEFPPTAAGKPVIGAIGDDTFRVPGISGKLVAGDRVTVTMAAPPGGKAFFDMGRVRGIPMDEVPPGAIATATGSASVPLANYRGVYTIRPGDDFEDGRIVGRFVSVDNVAAEPTVSSLKWTIETKPQMVFSIDRKELPADSTAKARIKIVAKDANGNPLKGRRLKLTLATTDQYTGTVGAGDFGKQVGGSVETRWRGETDAFGEVEFGYTSGFAAKTVILTAKDLDSGGVAVDYITAYKEASIDIALKKVVSRAAVRRSVQYVLKVEASRAELTADGRSRSVIRATLTDPNGTTVAGDPVSFSLSTPNGTLRTIHGTTDSSGVATAEYTAGKKIGIVVVTATATLRNAQGQVSIVLLADAPAKIFLAAKPDNLPADGVSRADIQVRVTDINDNPSRDTRVEFRIGRGGGKMEYPDRVTDRFGDAANRYTAGTEAGIATILATVRSSVPTAAEMSKARNVLFVPFTPDGNEIRVERWLRKKGDSFAKGDPLVEYTVGRQKEVKSLAAPFDGVLGEILVEYWDNAEVGQNLAVLIPRPK